MSVARSHPDPVQAVRGGLMAIADDDRRLRQLAVGLLAAAGLVLAVAVGSYVLDRYLVREESPLDQATRTLEDQVRQAPGDASLRLQVANAYARQGRYDAAMQQYDEALKLRTDWQPVLLAKAATELARHHDREAEALYRRVADLNQDNELRYSNVDLQEVYYRLGLFAAQAGRYPEAADWAREALRVDRTQSDALFLLGSSLEAQGQTAEAADAYRQSVSFDPAFREGFAALERADTALGNTAEAGYASGMQLLAAGDAEGALAAFRQVLAATPDFGEAYQGLGLAYARRGEREAAIAAFRAALERKPELLLSEWSMRSLGAER